MDRAEQLAELLLADRIRAVRGERTLDRFAADLGTSRQRIIDWEKGRSKPSTLYVSKLAADSGLPAQLFQAQDGDPIGELAHRVAAVHEQVLENRDYLSQHDLAERRASDERYERLATLTQALADRLAELEAQVAASIRLVDEGFQALSDCFDQVTVRFDGVDGTLSRLDPQERRAQG